MVKFGKEFRKFQVNQWKNQYINYKKLKQEIKRIRNVISESIKNEKTEIRITEFGHPNLQPQELDTPLNTSMIDLPTLYDGRYGIELKNFIDLLNKEFRKCYVHFVSQEKELYKAVNVHCSRRTMYKEYSIIGIHNEINLLTSTLVLTQQLNSFINDNVMAVKKILKKFDKNFQKYFGPISPKYIYSHLTSKNSDLEYLLQFKLIDESTTVCENSLNELKKLYDEKLKSNNPENENIENIQINNNINDFLRKSNDCLLSIDELTYFKIQYKEWFYYAKFNKRLVKNNPIIFENDIYNPILSSSYHKDSIIEKCLSSKLAQKEFKLSQSPLSHSNQTNLIFIFINIFIYGTLLTNIFPIIYFCLNEINFNKALLFIPLAFTYVGELIPSILYKYIDDMYLKLSYLLSYILIFIGSVLFTFIENKYVSLKYDSLKFILLIISRLFIGLGSNQMMNKKYLTLYLPKLYLSNISKIYLFVQILGIAFGPLIYYIISLKFSSFLIFDYNEISCIGYYGIITSIILAILHMLFFIQPLSDEFTMVKDEANIDGNKYYKRTEIDPVRKKYIKNQNKIYKKQYRSIKKQKKNSNPNLQINYSINGSERNSNIENLIIKNVNEEKEPKNNNIINNNNLPQDNNLQENLISTNNNNQKSSNKLDFSNENTSLDATLDANAALSSKQKNIVNYIENELEKRNDKCKFNDTNILPNVVKQIINKERKSYSSYININLLLIFIIFFLNALMKENYIIYYIYNTQEIFSTTSKALDFILFAIYIIQLVSIFFIYSFYQVNIKFIKILGLSCICLAVSNVLLIRFVTYIEFLYPILICFNILANNIIEIVCSCYVGFILSPGWKFLNINAGIYPNYLISFGKICGCLIGLLGVKNNFSNIIVISTISFIFVVFIGVIIIFTPIFNIKGITRVIKKLAIENIGDIEED